ncbi:hypothetical protein BGX38DRAFT_847991 [Terfezia claveryi]|nr:hypothetical protein BGX38DRAFT_847991 [Terfezia claveryi]
MFPPPRPKVSDVRHQHFEEALEKYGSGNCGVYHFARWVAIGQRGVKDPVLSRDLISSGAHHNGAYMFYRKIAPLIQSVSLLFQAVDPVMHLHYLQQYRAACELLPLASWTTSRRACFQGIVLIRNLAAEPHKDKSDYKDGWVVMCCWGKFTRGELVIPTLQQRG